MVKSIKGLQIQVLSVGSGFGLGEGIVPEAVLRPPMDFSEMLHSSEALSFSLRGLQGPVVRPHARRGVCAVSAASLLDVIGLVAATSALVVDFCVTPTKALGSFSESH